MTTLIRNIRMISPDLEVGSAALLLENGRIRATITPDKPLPSAETVIDGGGRIAMPGFFDIHSHGADGHDIGDNTAESVRHIARRKLQEGVTTWLPTTLTQAPDVLLEIASHCAEYRAAPEFCRVPGLHVEGPFINPENAGAQNPEFVRPPDLEELEKLHRTAPVKIVSLAPEMPGALDLIRAATGQGITCSCPVRSTSSGQPQGRGSPAPPPTPPPPPPMSRWQGKPA